MTTEMVKFLIIFMFGFDPQCFKKIALADSENRVEGMEAIGTWVPIGS